MIDPQKASEVAQAALIVARQYFGLSDEWEIILKADRLDEGISASINQLPDYMTATISYDPSQIETPADVWRRVGHEVAHLVFPEQVHYAEAVETHLGGEMPPVLFKVWQHANERSVSRLERMFVWDRPYPGADA